MAFVGKTQFASGGSNDRAIHNGFYIEPGTVGNVYYVSSALGSTSGPGFSPHNAYSTLDTAIGACTATNGDVIKIAPGHSETQASAAVIATLDVAGVTIIGMGHGSARPTFVFDHASASIAVSADDVTIENCIFKASAADVTRCFNVTGKNFRLVNCQFVDDAAADNFVDVIDLSSTTDNNADGLTVVGCEYYSDDTGNDGFIEVNADVDRLTFRDNTICMGVSDNEAIISMATGKDLTNCCIVGNRFYRLNTAGDIVVDSDTANNSGIVAFNVVGHADTQTEVLFDVTGARLFENYGTAVNDTSGFLVPTADS